MKNGAMLLSRTSLPTSNLDIDGVGRGMKNQYVVNSTCCIISVSQHMNQTVLRMCGWQSMSKIKYSKGHMQALACHAWFIYFDFRFVVYKMFIVFKKQQVKKKRTLKKIHNNLHPHLRVKHQNLLTTPTLPHLHKTQSIKLKHRCKYNQGTGTN